MSEAQKIIERIDNALKSAQADFEYGDRPAVLPLMERLADARAELAKADKRWRDIADEQPEEGQGVENRVSDHWVERGVAENRNGVWAIKGSGQMNCWRPVPSTEATSHE